MGESKGRGRSRDSPFLHFCHNGHGSSVGGASCVNGLMHGVFGTPQENSRQKNCKAKDRASCPDHYGKHYIYVHRDGTRKPCLNREDGRPVACLCAKDQQWF